MADSTNCSGSDSESSLTDWTVVDGQGEVEGCDSSSTSSSLEFVQLEDNVAVFQRKESEKLDNPEEASTEQENADKDGVLEATPGKNVEDVGPIQVRGIAEVTPTESETTMSEDPVCSSLVDDLNDSAEEEQEDKDEETLEDDSAGATASISLDPDVREVEDAREHEVESVGPEMPSSSDSDSDFVKLEPSAENSEMENLPKPAVSMETSAASSTSSAASRASSSSFSSNFRFVPLLPPSYQIYREASDEEDSLPGDIDDRCESDISGVAEDDSMDGDMSNMNYCIGDITLTAGRRLYRHSPNSNLNAILTTISMAALFIALGIGIGHYLGVSRESSLRRLQVTKMKIAQDNHLMCLKHASIVKERLNRLKDAARFSGSDQGLSGQDLKTCGDVWREKYDNMMVQNSKLELHIQELESREAMAEEQLLQSNMDSQQGTTEAEVQGYIKSLREVLNKAELENTDLRREVARLRYSAHPANSVHDPEAKKKEMKLKMNQLETENSDLKSVVGKMRYSQYPEELIVKEPVFDTDMIPCMTGNVNMTELQNELSEANRQLAAERKLNIMLRLTLARHNKPNRTVVETAEEQLSLHKCYQLLGPAIVNKTSKFVDMAKTSAVNYISILANSTGGNKQVLADKWEKIVNLLDTQSTESIHQQLGTLKDEVAQFLAVLSNATLKEGQAGATKETINKTAAFLKNITKPVAAHFQDYMNKTKQTVSKLSDTLQETWRVVKNLSNTFIEKHSEKVKGVHEKIVEKAKGVQNSIKKKWQSVRGKMEKNGWLKKEVPPPPGHKKAKHHMKGKHHKGKHHQKHNHGFHHGFDKKETREREEYEERFSQESARHFEDKPHHKQRQSSHEQYNEFWRKVDFDPDDYFHEGFFEGNQREWRKHQERLRHLHNRIHRLNEDILYSMDDDDIEDIYEDLDDLQDDMEDEDQPQVLQTWLACQVRWWKSRLQRKHRSQDLVKGCGRQIMQWQLRALCKDTCVGKRCSKKKYNLRYLPICREVLKSQDYYCLKRGSVIECHGRRGEDSDKNFPTMDSSQYQPAANARNVNVNPKPPRHNPAGRNEEDGEELFAAFSQPDEPRVDVDKINETETDLEEEAMDDDVPSFAMDSDYPEVPGNKLPISDRDGNEEDSSWQFERAIIREYYHQNPEWLFNRAAHRDFERTKPWYVGRSEGRELLRLKHQEKQAD